MVFRSPWGLLHHPSDDIFSNGVIRTVGGFYISQDGSVPEKKKIHTYLLGAITCGRPDGAGGAAGRMKNRSRAPVRDSVREDKSDVTWPARNWKSPGDRLCGDDGRRCLSEGTRWGSSGTTAARRNSNRGVVGSSAGFEAVD